VTKLTFLGGYEATGPVVTNTYSYSNGLIRTGLPHERANLGFAWIERKNDLTGSIRTYYHQDDFDLRLMVNKEEGYGTDGKLYTEKSYVYQKRLNSNNPEIKFIYPEQEILKNYNGEDGTPVTYQVENVFDAYGNPTIINDSGDVAVTGDESRIERNYNQFIDLVTYLFLPKYERKYGIKLNGQEGLAAETRYFYNTNYTLEREEKENGDQDVVIKYGYDDYGNVTAKIDGNNNKTTYVYDEQYATFLRYETLKFTTETVYDDLMRPVKTIDANGQIWETTYDVFSREKAKVSPGDSTTNPTTRVTYPDEFLDSSGNPIFPQCKKTEKKVADGNFIDAYVYTDGLNRVIQAKTEAGNGWVTVDHVYDEAGQEAQTSMPYFSTSSSYTVPDSNVKFITNVYDPIGRLTKVIKPDNTNVRQYYGKYDNIIVDELGHVTNQRIEGNIEYEIKYTGIYPSHTEYSRTTKINACNETRTIDPMQKVFTTVLDMLKRTVGTTSPMNGTWTYGYDGNDNPISRTDAKNQTILFEYDSMNRMTKKTYPDGSYVSYYFDETGNGYSKGRQTRIVYPGGSKSYTYDARGRKTTITKTINGLIRTKTMAYNSMDQLTSQTYSDGEILNYTYDAGGLLSKLNGASTYVSALNYFASAKISKMVFGNGVQTLYDYYDTTNESDNAAGTTFSYRLRQIHVAKTGSDIFNLKYEYEKNDNLKTKSDLSNNRFSETYDYDDLNRLTAANSTSYGSKTYQYDILNNILRKDNRSYQYNTANPYRLLNDGRYSYTYDTNGSIIGRSDGLTLDWDYENRLTSVSDGSSYTYDVEDQRIKKVENGITTYYFFNDYEEEYSGGVRTKSVKYYFADKQRIAERSSVDGVHYYHQDHLNSATAITDASGNLILRNNYAPYGEDAVSNGSASVKYKFSDKEKDIPGFYYFGARFYDPEVGRFITQDPAKDGVNWYAYCDDNPIRYLDPNGLAKTDPANGYIASTTAREIAFAVGHPIAAMSIGSVQSGSTNISTNAVRFSTQLGLQENATHEGSQVNACRHTIWQATIASKFGVYTALEAANAHEKNPFGGAFGFTFSTLAAADQACDLRNNLIGRGIGFAMGKGASMKDITSRVLDYFHEYGLWTATKEEDDSYSLTFTQLSDDAYDSATESLSGLDDNGWGW
jgi:RHS repeat-associated protein